MGFEVSLWWLHQKTLLSATLWARGREAGDQENQALPPRSYGAPQILGLSFLISKVRKWAYSIPKPNSSQELGGSLRPGPTLRLATKCLSFLIYATHPTAIYSLGTVLGAWNSDCHIHSVLATCRNALLSEVGILEGKQSQAPFPSHLFLEASGAASLTCPILWNMSEE